MSLFKKCKRVAGCFGLAIGVLLQSVDSNAAVKVIGSDVKVEFKYDTDALLWGKLYFGRASGYVNAKEYHYANAEIQESITYSGKKSGRKWGYGKVNAVTPYTDVSVLDGAFFSAYIYYGSK